ncbi:DeoR/GlpR family DNA-binding transcription regulator [Aeromicrobium sp. NPDC092404]|uniref:DeoR/GlpR family DNA-binding transcription regulator n=1 Tax=Aeromicrobium sp. NPDC092404 TaxID=3154976 RepID=UPI00341511D7
MKRSLRHKSIIHAVSGRQEVSVVDLARLTGASAVTIRRDLVELEAHGVLSRTHGGARQAFKRGSPLPFSVRLGSDQGSKAMLAEVAADLVQDGEAVIIDNGTTCFEVARQLAGRPITALALSLHAAAALASQPGTYVTVPGGTVETDSLAMTAAGIDAVRDVRADVAIVGACSASATHGLTSTTYEDVQLKRAILRSASRVVLVADASKLSRSSAFRFGGPEDITHLVTTPDAPDELLQMFRGEGVSVLLVQPDRRPDAS